MPCLIIANELFEIQNGEFLNKIKSSKFLGFHENIDESLFSDIKNLDIKRMSENGMKNLNTKASENIFKEIKKL